ncbi:hypothetical protein D3C76_1502210 [compost metagenome]
MSILAEFRQLEKHLAEQLKVFEALKSEAGLKQEFSHKLNLKTSHQLLLLISQLVQRFTHSRRFF